MAKAKTKAAGIALRVPQSDAEAEQMIAELGASHRDEAEAKDHHDAQVAALKEGYGETVRAFQKAQADLTEGLSVWASANRERLTRSGKTKTAHFESGSISWRDGVYAVKHRGLKNEDVLVAIQERIDALEEGRKQAKADGLKVEAAKCLASIKILQGMIRWKAEPNKDAMIAGREIAETIRGVTVPRGPEEFIVKPLASQISEVA